MRGVDVVREVVRWAVVAACLVAFVLIGIRVLEIFSDAGEDPDFGPGSTPTIIEVPADPR